MKKYAFTLLFLFIVSLAAFSHAMFLELVEPGVFQVQYDGGGFTPGTKVILYSDGGFDVIQEGEVDDKGFYRFDSSLKVMSAEASDGAGHVAYWEASEEEMSEEETSKEVESSEASSEASAAKPKRIKTKRPSKLPIILTVLNTCAIVFLFFEFRTFKKKVLDKKN
ncbi:hypothetical protein E4O00_02840 [Treponema sp. OMZ 788]|uniref:hypothetical protein n=1 Tax=Treponema sp. OMZ 788 TaxID=2563664 RepID=UPI0020A59C12|nr:hypothetical protein [Treponema sp. OMZ 788]UTC65122.1 hypothetical protein E4O00_02840 [Treponema sp. OMZ 788]